MLEITQKLRPKSLIPPYPNYHSGDYFEEFFLKRFLKEYPNMEVGGFKYIPIFWTNCYTNKSFYGVNYDIQNTLNTLDDNQNYFTISQHDDCIYEKLPTNTIVFSMGGNKKNENIIPIPLICSPIKYKKTKKNIKVSFVGSLTHPLREEIFNHFRNDSDFIFHVKNWELSADKLHIDRFNEITSKSYFTLSPRGYGATSFRLYEALQMDSIPIYVYDTLWLPWQDEIDWSKISVLVKREDISNIKNMIDNQNYDTMIEYKNQIYDDYFTYDGTYNNIIKRLKNGNIKI